MAEEKITLEELAKMINKSFEKVSTKEQVDNFEKWTKEKINKIENRLEKVERKLTSVDEKIVEADKLAIRVEYIENILDLPAKK